MTKIALVGHCGVDGPSIEAQIRSIIDAADVCSCNDANALNRVCGEGVDLMAEVRESHPDVKMMLISDYPDAQAAAREVGALPGFGKADLGTSKVKKALRDALS